MNRRKNNLYNFDIVYEKKTYRNVGLDYSPRGIFKIMSEIRKWKNKDEKQYKVCNTYSEWEEYICGKLHMRGINQKNFTHWLIDKRRAAENSLEITKIILIPIYIAFFSTGIIFPVDEPFVVKPIFLFIGIITIMIFSMVIFHREKEWVDFWEDLNKIVKDNSK